MSAFPEQELSISRRQLTHEEALELGRIGAERLAADRAVTRDVRRGVVLGALGCVLSCVAGAFFLGLAFWTSDAGLGDVFFWTGMVVCYSGITASMLALFLWGDKRGYWV